MGKLLKWQEEYTTRVDKMSNRELLDEVYDYCGDHEYDDVKWANREAWRDEFCRKRLETKLEKWLEQ